MDIKERDASKKVEQTVQFADGDSSSTVLIAQGVQIRIPDAAVQSIPVLEALLSGRFPQKRNEDGVICTDMNPKTLYSCVAFAAGGSTQPHVLLTKLSRKESSVDKLVEMADYLCIDLPTVEDVIDLVDLEKKLKDIKQKEIMRVARRSYERSYEIPDRQGARDAAAVLCFTIAKQSLSQTNQIRSKLSNDVLFVVSHARTFGPRLRTHTWRAFESKFSLTSKQWKQFERWVSEEGLRFQFDCEDGCGWHLYELLLEVLFYWKPSSFVPCHEYKEIEIFYLHSWLCRDMVQRSGKSDNNRTHRVGSKFREAFWKVYFCSFATLPTTTMVD
jgi:hypothetical protein